MHKTFLPFTLMILAGCLYLLTGSLPVSPIIVQKESAQIAAVPGDLPNIQPTPDPAHQAVMMLSNQQGTCANPGQIYTSYPPKCLSSEGKLIIAGGHSQQAWVMPVPGR